MEITDKDLASIQQVRTLVSNARKAKNAMAKMSQQQLDKITLAIKNCGEKNARHLARLAVSETGFGNEEDKTTKNIFASTHLYEAIKNMKTVGLINSDEENGVYEYGCPVGIIGALVPSTNPTSTVIYKAMIAIKSGNPIIFSPHPKALGCILETVKLIYAAATEAGLPGGGIGCITIPTIQATDQLMKHRYTNLILATGGPGMVKAAYSSGTPAIGVGAGNGPALIDETADVKKAIEDIIRSKTFDFGTICASEQSVVTTSLMEKSVVTELVNQGGYIMTDEESDRLGKILFKNGKMNGEIVGKTAYYIGKKAGFNNVDENTKILVAKQGSVGVNAPYSQEKLAPVIALYVEDNIKKAIDRCVEILQFEGAGHSFMVHTKNNELVHELARQIPASRIMVNTPGSLGGVGYTTNLFPAFTLGCGGEGGSSSSNNISPMDLINIKRVAYGKKKEESNVNDIDYIVEAVIKRLL